MSRAGITCGCHGGPAHGRVPWRGGEGVGPRLATTRTSSRGGTVIDNLVTVLGVVAPAAVVVGTVAAIAREGVQGTVPADLVVPTMALTFLALVARLVLAALRHPERRIAMLAMAMALVLWAAGSAQVNGATDVSAMEFPAPGELFFAASFLALAAHLFLDVGSWVHASASSWLEAAVASGGAMCVVALLAVTPLADEFARQGVPLVVALVSPAMDAVLLTVVIGQIVLHRRAASLGTGLLVAGFVVLTVADTL